MRRLILVTVAVVALTASLRSLVGAAADEPGPYQQAPAPQRQPIVVKIGPNDYDVVPNWSLPYPKAGYAWGSVPGVFVESDDRIFVASRGEIKLPDSACRPAILGFFGIHAQRAQRAGERSARLPPRRRQHRQDARNLVAVGQALRRHERSAQDQDQPLRSAAPRLGRRRNQAASSTCSRTTASSCCRRSAKRASPPTTRRTSAGRRISRSCPMAACSWPTA